MPTPVPVEVPRKARGPVNAVDVEMRQVIVVRFVGSPTPARSVAVTGLERTFSAGGSGPG